MDLSVVIVNWNTCDVLRDCLVSVYRCTEGIGLEVIVVDNASVDHSTEMVRQRFPQVVLIENERNVGYAAANNIGIQRSQGRYVLVLNSDTLIFDNALPKMVAFADANPDVAVCGCQVLNPDRTLQQTCFMYPSVLNMFLFAIYLNKLFPKSRFFGRERMTWWDQSDVREVEVVTGCFMLVRREALDRVGMMDKDFFMYGEETDWCYRFKQAGWKVLFTPDAQIIHLGAASSARAASEMTLQLKAGVLQFMHKHRSWPAYAAACGLMALFLALRIPFWFVKAVVSHRDRSDAWSRVSTYTRALCRLTGGWRGLRGTSLKTS